MRPKDSEAEAVRGLLELVRQGDESAFGRLFDRYRDRLERAIALRLDPRLQPRVDASDVLQETYLEAARKLPEYTPREDLPFYLWLRWIARERVIDVHRRHVGAGKRDVGREVPLLPADASTQLLHALAGSGPTPSQAAVAAERLERLHQALAQLDEEERELILWRHFERLSHREAAQLLGINEDAAGKRYLRALERLRELLHRLGVTSAG